MISLHEGSILDVPADAVVLPANSFLNHEGGLARVLDQLASGVGLSYLHHQSDSVHGRVRAYTQDQLRAGLVPVGGAHAGPAGMLPFKALICAVGPVWGGGQFFEYDLLRSAYAEVFKACHQHGWESVAVPAIGAGIFGCPIDVVLGALYSADYFKHGGLGVILALTDPAHVAEFRRQA